MQIKKLSVIAIASLLSVAIVVPVLSQDMLHGADAIAKRQEVMKSNGATLRGAGAATGADAVAAGQTLVDSFALIAELFPEDSQTGDTKALPAIWTDNAGFLVAYTNAANAAAAVLAAAESGDMAAYGDAVKVMGDMCGACHTAYRAAKN